MKQIPEGWLPHVNRDKIYWFWAPSDWSITTPLSKGCYYALSALEGQLLMEVFVLNPPAKMVDPARNVGEVFKRSVLEDHPDLKVLREGACRLDETDDLDALSRMKAMGLMNTYGFVEEMYPPLSCYQMTIEYAEHAPQDPSWVGKSTTDFFSLYQGDLVLQLNMKAMSPYYAKWACTFELIAASARLGRFA